jgi:Uma2 family endonuclease
MAVETRKMTAREFLMLPESNQFYELIHGEEITSLSPSVLHQMVVGNLHVMLRALISNGHVFIAPLDLYIDETNVVQPDLMWISAENTAVLLETNLVRGAPDLVVEVLSPGTALRDRRAKFHLYEKVGVREYWMVDVEDKLLEIWQLADGRFMRVDAFGAEDECMSLLVGKVDVKAIFG